MEASALDSLARLYALDLLPPAERATVEAALPHHAELARLVADLKHAGKEGSGMEGLGRLMAQVQADETQRDHVATQDPKLRADLVELLALYSAMSRKLEALASPPPPEPLR